MNVTPIGAEFCSPQQQIFAASRAARPAWRHAAVDSACFLTLMAADLAAAACATFAFLAAVYLTAASPAEAALPSLAAFTPQSLLIGMVMLSCFIVQGHYTKRLPFWSETKQITLVSLCALLAAGFAECTWRGSFSPPLLIGVWGVFPAFSVALRWAAKRILQRAGLWQLTVVVIADRRGAEAARFALASEPQLGYDIVGTLTPEQLPAPYRRHHFKTIMDNYDARRLVLAINIGSQTGRRLVQALVRERVAFSLIPQVEGLPVFGYDQVAFFSHDTVLLSYRNNLAQPVSVFVKAAFDIIFALLLLLGLGVPMLLIALLVRLDGGPALFGQERIGAGGRPFRCLKFRTMVTNADQVLRDLLDHDPLVRAEWAETQKLRVDPRITRMGRVLRATSLDELPQLFNVLRLEMSLVGPRPIVRQEIARYADDIAFYYEARPGLTGLWQVSGRSDTTYKRRVELDTWYVRNWTIWHDIAILLKTVPALIGRTGAR